MPVTVGQARTTMGDHVLRGNVFNFVAQALVDDQVFGLCAVRSTGMILMPGLASALVTERAWHAYQKAGFKNEALSVTASCTTAGAGTADIWASSAPNGLRYSGSMAKTDANGRQGERYDTYL